MPRGIRELQIQEEKLSAESFKIKLKDVLTGENYAFAKVYNVDETGLNSKASSRKSLTSRRELAAPGPEIRKARVIDLACANATDRQRLPMFVIGKARNYVVSCILICLWCLPFTIRKRVLTSIYSSTIFKETLMSSAKAHQLKSSNRKKT